nr:hypothetical protein [Tanacetum cinerariifolium]
MRTYIPRQREEAKQRLVEEYLGEDATPPKYSEEKFRRSTTPEAPFVVNGGTYKKCYNLAD